MVSSYSSGVLVLITFLCSFQVSKFTINVKLIVCGLPGETGQTVLNHVVEDKGQKTGPPKDPLLAVKNVQAMQTIQKYVT